MSESPSGSGCGRRVGFSSRSEGLRRLGRRFRRRRLHRRVRCLARLGCRVGSGLGRLRRRVGSGLGRSRGRRRLGRGLGRSRRGSGAVSVGVVPVVPVEGAVPARSARAAARRGRRARRGGPRRLDGLLHALRARVRAARRAARLVVFRSLDRPRGRRGHGRGVATGSSAVAEGVSNSDTPSKSASDCGSLSTWALETGLEPSPVALTSTIPPASTRAPAAIAAVAGTRWNQRRCARSAAEPAGKACAAAGGSSGTAIASAAGAGSRASSALRASACAVAMRARRRGRRSPSGLRRWRSAGRSAPSSSAMRGMRDEPPVSRIARVRSPLRPRSRARPRARRSCARRRLRSSPRTRSASAGRCCSPARPAAARQLRSRTTGPPWPRRTRGAGSRARAGSRVRRESGRGESRSGHRVTKHDVIEVGAAEIGDAERLAYDSHIPALVPAQDHGIERSAPRSYTARACPFCRGEVDS